MLSESWVFWLKMKKSVAPKSQYEIHHGNVLEASRHYLTAGSVFKNLWMLKGWTTNIGAIYKGNSCHIWPFIGKC